MLVTDATEAQGLVVARSLGRAGWTVIATHPTRSVPTGTTRRFGSRWAARTVTVPDPEFDGIAAGRAIGALARDADVDLIFPTTDKSILAVLDHGEVEDRCVAVAPRSALELAWNKTATIALAETLGVPIPRSIPFSTESEAWAGAAELGWPAVLKPSRSHEWQPDGTIRTRAVHVVRRAEDWSGRFGSELPSAGMVQEYLPGYGVGIEILARRGQVDVAFQHRRIHEVPHDGGMSARRVAEHPDPELLAYSAALIKAMDWDGLVMVEFRITPDGPRLMELNGRVWGSIALPVRAGVDFPRLAAELHLDRRTTKENIDLLEGLECVNFELELRWLVDAVRRRWRGSDQVTSSDLWKTARALVDPRTEFDIQQMDDLAPSVLGVLASVTRVSRDVGVAVVHRPKPS